MFNRNGQLLLGIVLVGGISACDLNSVLQVSDPSRYTDEGLDTPDALPAVANGVEGSMQFIAANIAIYTGLLSDELMHTGTWSGYEDADQGRMRPPPGPGFSISSQTLYGVRTSAQKAAERFERVKAANASVDIGKFMSQVTASEGWSNLLMAETECEDVAVPGGPAVPDTDMYAAAITSLTNAISVAQAAGQTAYVNFARAGRARAYLMIGQYDEALADAQQIPKGFEYDAKYSEASTSNSLVTLNFYAENKAAGLDARRWSQVDTTNSNGNDYFIDKWSSQPDPRVPIVLRVGNRLGVDGKTKFYSQNKYTERGADIPMTHWREMRLIEAEVYWKKGDFATAIAKMNEVRTDVGLPDLTNPGTSQGVLDMLLEERFATLFLEGHRANDLYRFNLFPSVIGTGFNTKFPMNSTEVINNPLISQPRSCPAVS
jgi:tetratricopeptide (TPR) repeat protein